MMYGTYERNDLGGFSDESMSQLFVERDKMANINVAIVLLEENVFADLISGKTLAIVNKLHGEDRPVNEGIVQTELQNELLQLRLNLAASILVVVLGWQNAQ
jgi:hypothetical protein